MKRVFSSLNGVRGNLLSTPLSECPPLGIAWDVGRNLSSLTTDQLLFSGFDNTCDLSAVLGILANASVFQPSVQDNARRVRSEVRNEWGHCNFDHWGEIEFTNCFKLMKTLVSSLKRPTEKEICSDLLEWEKNGEFVTSKLHLLTI